MPLAERPHGTSLADALREVHADDVRRARTLIDQAVAQADAAWVPRNALAEALAGALRDLSRPIFTVRPDA